MQFLLSYQNWGPSNPASTGPDTYVHLVAGSFDSIDFSGKWMSCGFDRGFKEFPQTCNIKECAAGTKFDENNENCIPDDSGKCSYVHLCSLFLNFRKKYCNCK